MTHMGSAIRVALGRVATPLGVALLTMALLMMLPATAQSGAEFPGLASGQRIYDQTSTSLTPPQLTDLQQRVEDLVSTGADPVVYVRELNATPEQTLEQVEALQQAWVRGTGADQDTAVAVLINRNPDDPTDARAGVFVGRTYDDGNVGEGEQLAIVDEALIPPLRDGDVHGSLAAGVERLTSSIRNGPPQDAFEEWAADASDSWLPWAAMVAALIGLAAAVAVFRSRQTADRPDQRPTITRPGDLSPALAGALVLDVPQPSAVPATLLDLAGRGALAIEPERVGGTFRDPTVQVRLLDERVIHGEVEATVWAELVAAASGGVVPSKDLQKVASSPKPVLEAVRRQMRAEGWQDQGAGGRRAALVLIGCIAMVLGFFALVVAGVSGDWRPLSAGIAALALLAVMAFVFAATYSRLSREGQEAAIPWRAYRDGLKRAVKDDAVGLNLDAVLPDLVAVNLGSMIDDRMKAASKSGQTLRAFSATTAAGAEMPNGAHFAWWAAFNSSTASTASTSGYGGGTVSGGGAGGGGGAAGST